MLRPRNVPADRRRAVILMVVLALLTLFAIVGITFAFYASKSHSASVNFREAWQLGFQSGGGGGGIGGGGSGGGSVSFTPVGQQAIFNWAYAQLIYDANDDATGVYSAIRGQSLGRTMYGLNDALLNLQPFNGTGRLHYQQSAGSIAGQDDYQLINYTYFPSDGFLRDPERLGTRAALTDQSGQPVPRGPYTGGANANYTYPDLNSFFLAAARADGTQLMPSFHRPWLFNPGRALNDQTNPNWTNAIGKYLIARPRPIDMDPANFPYPSDANGDVKNKLGAPGGNDSIFMDMGYPVTVSPDGTKYKPLFAWRVEDLDNRINVNTAGNLMAMLTGTSTHASSQGWGRWEMNLSSVLNAPWAPAEWRQVFLGVPNSTTTPPGRYGPDGLPRSGSPNFAPGGKQPRNFAQVDYNAADESNSYAATGLYTLPTAPYVYFPTFPSGFSNGFQQTTAPYLGERYNHARLYDYFRPNGLVPTNPPPPPNTPPPWDDRILPVSDMQYLLYNGTAGNEVMSSQLAQLCPQNFSPAPLPAPQGLTPQQVAAINRRRRNLVTTYNMDINRMGLAPWLYDRQQSGYATVQTSTSDLPPLGGQVAFPPLPPAANSPRTAQGNVPQYSDFGTPTQPNYLPTPPAAAGTYNPLVDWRAIDAALEKVDLNRSLAPYPHQLPDPNNANQPLAGSYDARFDTSSNANVASQFQQAQSDRQALAADIYKRLKSVTGVPMPATPGAPTDAELEPLRWLAQLAVNIVDFIDEDEISTPFNFYTTQDAGGSPTFNVAAVRPNPNTGESTPRYWVFGTELPPVVLNEVLTEYQLPTDPTKGNIVIDGTFQVKVWAELFTPYRAVKNSGVQPQDGQPIPFYIPGPGGAANGSYSVYDVVIANNNTNVGANPGPLFPQRDNVLGIPEYLRADTRFLNAQTPTVDPKLGPVATGVNPAAGGLFLVGPPPSGSPADNTITPPQVPAATPWYQAPTMQYPVKYTAGVWTDATGATIYSDGTAGITVLLRRLANPHLPPQTDLTKANYNPYVTIDYLNKITLNNNTTQTASFQSVGKKQPYAAATPQLQAQSYWDPKTGKPTSIQHSLGSPNNIGYNAGTPPTPIPPPAADWLVHLDRQLSSPAELLNVSGFWPHRLTHRFITNAGKFQHLVPWFDQDLVNSNPPQSHRLYRLFAFLENSDQATGIALRGRVPGRLNINTIWEFEVLQSLLDGKAQNDPTRCNYFLDTDVQNLWANLLRTRTPGMLNAGVPTTTGGSINPGDRPFLDLSAAFMPGGAGGDPQTTPPNGGVPIGRGLEDTIFRRQDPTSLTNTLKLFQPAPGNATANAHPYLQNEMLAKVMNNVTTRSNVFAVWLTVGFFNVSDDTTFPVKLGAEVGASTGTNIRYRFFAIVDRTQVVLAPALAQSIANGPGMPPVPGGRVTTAELNQPKQVFLVPKQALTDPFNSIHGTITYANGSTVPWAFGPGSLVVIDRGTPNEEVVMLQDFPQQGYKAADPGNPPDLGTYGAPGQTPPSIAAIFRREHEQGFTITMYGNPGPQPQFDPTNPAYTPVVPFYTILQ